MPELEQNVQNEEVQNAEEQQLHPEDKPSLEQEVARLIAKHMASQKPAEVKTDPEQAQQISELRAALAAEREARIAMERQHAEEAAAASARETRALVERGGDQAPSNAQIDMSVDRAVKAAGGLARFNQWPLERKLSAVGEPPTSPEEIQQAKETFGPTSIGGEAQSLKRFQPRKYSRLRLIHRLAGGGR